MLHVQAFAARLFKANVTEGFTAGTVRGAPTSGNRMAMADDWGQVANDAARLEAALERLGRLRPAHPPEPGPAPNPQHQPGAELAGRIDALIAELRAALGSLGAD